MSHLNIDSSFQLSQQKFGRYQVGKLLGEGAMGRVYLARDPVLDRLVALKVIALDRTVDEGTRREFFERFTLEARASAKLNHPSIVTIHDAGEDAGVPWIAFEFVKGSRLDEMIHSEKVFPFKKVRTICTQLASALKCAHEMHIVHRDIKPQNILIDERTHIAKLSDFGVAKAPWAGLTREGNNVGSPGYMSPEQIEGTGIDNRSDLYCLGIVIYEMITGKHPFIKETIAATFYATLNGVYAPITNYRPDTPDDLKTIVKGLLQADPSKRIQSAADILSLIDNGSTTLSGTLPGYIRNVNHIHLLRYVRLFRHLLVQSEHVISRSLENRHFKKRVGIIGDQLSRFISLVKHTGHRIIMNLTVAFTTYFPVIIAFCTRRRVTILKTAAVILPLCLIPVILKPSCDDRKRDPASEKGITALNELKEAADDIFPDLQFDSSQKTARDPVRQNMDSYDEKWIQAQQALKNANYTEALTLMGDIAEKGGKHLFTKDKIVILDQLQNIFRNGEAPAELIQICSQPLKPIFSPVINDWLDNSHYWVRWNTISVCKALNRKVDMVKIYILDLKTAASMRTRIRAAEKLGELGDRRAVATLEEVSKRGFRDPFVSRAAADVLKQYFNK